MAIKYLSIEEIGERLHISKLTVRDRITRGLPMPPSIKIGQRRLFREDVFDEWMALQQENTECIRENSAAFQSKLAKL